MTRAECIATAGRVFREALAEMAALPPRQAAELAYYPGSPSVDELERRITDLRRAPLQQAA
ncbi:hypothetical protein ABT324_24120 [Saccharopolyspora sp. NPDC000359]|uniref:hypothetical protein n=1 Tax=Saccharopolyspora sp. NPDC000359 TaxID=3154251 RepID=UPI003316AE07